MVYHINQNNVNQWLVSSQRKTNQINKICLDIKFVNHIFFINNYCICQNKPQNGQNIITVFK